MNTLDTLTTYADDATQKVRKTAQQVAGQASDFYGQAGESFRDGYRQTEQMVRKQPLESVAICFAAGLIGGFCLALAVRGMR